MSQNTFQRLDEKLVQRLASQKCTRKDIAELVSSSVETFKDSLHKNAIQKEDLRYLLSKVDLFFTANRFVSNVDLFCFLLKESIVTFKEIVDKLASDKNLILLLESDWSDPRFRGLIRSGIIQPNDIRHLVESVQFRYDCAALTRNQPLIQHILKKRVLSFKDLTDIFKHTAESHGKSSLGVLFFIADDKQFFRRLMKLGCISDDDLRYAINNLDDSTEIKDFLSSYDFIAYLLDSDIISQSALVRLCCQNSIFPYFISHFNTSLQKKLFDEKLLSTEDFQLLWSKLSKTLQSHDCTDEFLCVFKYVVDNNIITFRNFVNKLTASSKFDYALTKFCQLLNDEQWIVKLFNEHKISTSDLQHLCKRLKESADFETITENRTLLKKILEEHVLTDDIVEQLKTTQFKHQDIFSVLKTKVNQNDKELVKLIDDNETLHTFKLRQTTYNHSEQLQLAEILQKSMHAKSIMKQLIDSNLLDQYTFTQLSELLNKNDKKQKIKMNF